MIAGIPARGIADEYEKRTGKTAINWQPHTVRIGKDGDFVWPLAKAYEEMALRVEADGYVPSVAMWLKKSAGPQHIVLMLKEDPGVKGRVLQPDGQAGRGRDGRAGDAAARRGVGRAAASAAPISRCRKSRAIAGACRSS